MSIDRTRLPDPVDFYTNEGLSVTGRGAWRTTSCVFHSGSDSMRIHAARGAFVCMNCGARGGDVLAYRRAVHGESFVDAARALGAWVDDGKLTPTRPTPISARDAIMLITREANFVAIAAANVAHGIMLSDADLKRLLKAVSRISRIGELFA